MNTHKVRSARRSRGFSLIELLVVLVILGLLAGLVGPQVMKHVGESKSKAARLQIEELSAALDMYRLEVGRYPTADEGLEALVSKPPGAKRWNGPYLKKTVMPKDPWDFDFVYEFPGEHGAYDLSSLGADNATGGEDENADVLGWE